MRDDILIQDRHGSVGRWNERAEDSKERRLPAAVGAEKSEDFASRDRERDAIECDALTVSVRNVLHGDDRCRRCFFVRGAHLCKSPGLSPGLRCFKSLFEIENSVLRVSGATRVSRMFRIQHRRWIEQM